MIRKVYTTRDALDLGILEVEVEDCLYNGYVNIPLQGLVDKCFCHNSRESAVKQANEMRENMIGSHEREIERLRKLKF